MTRSRDLAGLLTTASTLATDTETAAAISSHSSSADPHGDRAYAAALIPSQTGNTGKYLTTDGSAVSWGAISGGATIPDLFLTMGA
jgi:hypothetical protein